MTIFCQLNASPRQSHREQYVHRSQVFSSNRMIPSCINFRCTKCAECVQAPTASWISSANYCIGVECGDRREPTPTKKQTKQSKNVWKLSLTNGKLHLIRTSLASWIRFTFDKQFTIFLNEMNLDKKNLNEMFNDSMETFANENKTGEYIYRKLILRQSVSTNLFISNDGVNDGDHSFWHLTHERTRF